MCDPVIGAVIGGGQAALGVMGQNKALAARNKNRALLYSRDLKTIHGEHLINISNYYLRGVDAEIEWDDNAQKASQAVDAQQVILNIAIANSLRETENDYVKMISDPRIAKSLERSGASARRIASSAKAIAGRAKAQRYGKIDDAGDKAAIAFAEIQQLRRKADRDALIEIGLTPQRAADPPKPVFEKGPSLFSTLTKIALGAAQGYFMGESLKGGTDPGFMKLPDYTGEAFNPANAAKMDLGFQTGTSLGIDYGVNTTALTTKFSSQLTSAAYRGANDAVLGGLNFGNTRLDWSSIVGAGK